MTEKAQEPDGEEPRDNKDTASPATVLDSILRDGGPMPPARLPMRGLAYLLDCILLFAAVTLLLGKVALPLAHPSATYEFQQWVQAFSESGDGEMPPMSPGLIEALEFAQTFMIILFWAYFAAGEAFFNGTSLGKRACRLRTVSIVTLDKPNIFNGIVRAGAKTFVLFFAPLLLLDLIFLFFNKRRQTGHDIVTRTAVIDEKFVKTEPA